MFWTGSRSASPAPGQLRIAIVGASVDGLELAAELHRAARRFVAYRLDSIDPDKDFSITLIEAAPTVLPALSPELQDATRKQLEKLGIEMLTSEQEVKATESGRKPGAAK